jgi:hypothetical protein
LRKVEIFPPQKKFNNKILRKKILNLQKYSICTITPSSPCLWAPPFTPYSLFQWYPQSNHILLNLSMKCWYSAFNARGSRLIIVVVQFRISENICSSSGGAQEKGQTGWNSVYHQNWWFSEFDPQLNANVLFCRFFKKSHPVNDQTHIPWILYGYN